MALAGKYSGAGAGRKDDGSQESKMSRGRRAGQGSEMGQQRRAESIARSEANRAEARRKADAARSSAPGAAKKPKDQEARIRQKIEDLRGKLKDVRNKKKGI